jgi:hypothetical protein
MKAWIRERGAISLKNKPQAPRFRSQSPSSFPLGKQIADKQDCNGNEK